jgi:hypothetical protein
VCDGGASSLSFDVDREWLQGSSDPGSYLGGGVSSSSMIGQMRSGHEEMEQQ